MVFLLQVAGCVLSVLAMRSSSVEQWSRTLRTGIWALPSLQVLSTLRLKYGSDAAFATQADSNIQLA